jgi:shikimate dehydrogenase
MRKFGLIGYPLGHSFSEIYFREKFRQASIDDCVYSNYELGVISDLTEILKDPELAGLNVTIPYKESVIPFLHRKDPVVEEIKACNCIRIDKGLLTGYNTDVQGFEESLSEKLTGTDHRALILGTGGSSKAVAWVLRKKGIPFLFVSRKEQGAAGHISYKDLNSDILDTHTLIINCTPLGMFPKIKECPPIPYDVIGPAHYLFDLVYNPEKTLFLEKGETAGARIKNGADMLRIQAEASWRIWNTGSGG